MLRLTLVQLDESWLAIPLVQQAMLSATLTAKDNRALESVAMMSVHQKL
jgi:hypothetical protein